MRAIILFMAVPLLYSIPALAQNPSPASGEPAGRNSQEFLGFASEVNVSEIREGVLAEQKANSETVRAFARLMTLDHTELESQLEALAALDRMQVPDKPNPAAGQQLAQLKSMSGAQFDTAYMEDMVQGHEKAVRRFQSEKSNAQDPMVRTASSSALPILQQHLALAKAVVASLEKANARAAR